VHTLVAVGIAVGLVARPEPAPAFHAPELSLQEQAELKQNFALCLSKLKGPYTENFCLCRDGRKLPVQGPGGQVRVPCKDPLFCAAYRAPWAEALARDRMYIANIFSRDLYLWNSFPNHDDLVRGYILEKYFVETNPTHKLAQLKAYRGLSSAEEETGASVRFFERYLTPPGFDGGRDFLLAYELQRRYFVRDDLGQVEKVRNQAVRIEAVRPDFKPLKDAVHNQISAGLIPGLAAYRDRAQGAVRTQVDELIREIEKLTTLDESALRPQIAAIADPTLRAELAALAPPASAAPIDALAALGRLMVRAREAVAARTIAAADARRLVDLEITAALVVQQRGTAVLEGGALTVRDHLRTLAALVDAGYGTGLLGARERQAAASVVAELLAAGEHPRQRFAAILERAERVAEWAQASVELAFAEVAAPWTFLLPQTAGLRDDILRGSPLLLYAQFARRLDDVVAGSSRPRHHIFGTEVTGDIRALNPGLALGLLRIAPATGAHARDEIVALAETPADLEPAAGILTQGEGNLLSHVQLLARALGIPNVVLGPTAFATVRKHDGERVLLIATQGGRVILKAASAMSPEEHLAYGDYTRNVQRTADGRLGGGRKLHIDRSKIDLGKRLPIDLTEVRRKDSGVFCGPKAAYLGELKHLFPSRVPRGIVVPFGAYYDHYQHARVVVPDKLRALGIARPGDPLPAFVEQTYREFFGGLLPKRRSEQELSAWIAPRLEIIRQSIRATPIAPELRQAIRDGLDRNGLLSPNGTSTVGCFVRSDTNVEDLDDFNGAGLNLTLFNRTSLDELYAALVEVWASPFQFRSFSWRQTLIDDPAWVLSSVVILESVPSEKSGVLVTADVMSGARSNSGAPSKMLVATSEGVGGAVDGTSAETLLWSPTGVELVTLYKSPWRNDLDGDGGSRVVPSSGGDTVLLPAELAELVAAGQAISAQLEPVRDPTGVPRPWDIEFGFEGGKLWLFQCRPFLGNDDLKNLPALAAFDGPSTAAKDGTVSLEEVLQ